MDIQAVLDQCRSSKINQRKQGIEELVQRLKRPDAYFYQLSRDPDNPQIITKWLVILQAVFEYVLEEKRMVDRKVGSRSKTAGKPVEQRNLEKASVSVREFVEHSHKSLRRKCCTPLFHHLIQMLSCGGDVFENVGLQYANTLKQLIEFRPHLEHMEHESWVRALEISFNVILGDPIGNRFSLDDEEAPNSSESEATSDEETDTDAVVGQKRRRSNTGVADPSMFSPNPGRKRKRHQPTTASAVQIIFAEILATLLSSEHAPILVESKDEPSKKYPALSAAVLNRLHRILQQYSGESPITKSCLKMITGILDYLELNAKDLVAKFANNIWQDLVGLWTNKTKDLKPTLILILRRLFHFIVLSDNTQGLDTVPPESSDKLQRLWSVLYSEYDNRKVPTLSVDSLRLEITDRAPSGTNDPFSGATFCAGPDLTSEEVSHWVSLELQADCAARLFQLSESVHANESDHKRARRGNALPSMLVSLETAVSPNARIHYLQMLLFFIDRHWHILHDKIKQNIFIALNQCLSVDDNGLQSWVFVNFAAMTHAEKFQRSLSSVDQAADEVPLGSQTWDSIWAHAVRRMNVPGVCRAACHAGNVVLMAFYPTSAISSSNCLTSERVLLDIESAVKDIDVQGPSYPYDSVCMFISRCLSIAAQDVRLNQLRLEDKALSWMLENWSTVQINRTKLNTHRISDVLLLFSRICGLGRPFYPHTYPTLPNCDTVDFIHEERKINVLTDLLLHARLSDMTPGNDQPAKLPSSQQTPSSAVSFSTSTAPRPRERKISAFFAKTLEKVNAQVEQDKDSGGQFTQVSTRGYLDAALAALLFECLLQFNGIAPNKVVIQLSAKLVPSILTRLNDRWDSSEKLFVLQTLEVLVPYSDAPNDDALPNPLCCATPHSGIKQATLLSLQTTMKNADHHINQLDFYRHLWQDADTREPLNKLSDQLYFIMNRQLSLSKKSRTVNRDPHDEFSSTQPTRSTTHYDHTTEHIFQICLRLKLRGQSLQSQGDPNCHQPLIESMLKALRDYQAEFLAPLNLFFQEVENGVVCLSATQLDAFIEEAGGHLKKTYTINKNTGFIKLIIKIMNAGLSTWIHSDNPSPSVQTLRQKVQKLCHFISQNINNQHYFDSWRLRNAIALFLQRYLRHDPLQAHWIPDTFDDQSHLLPRSLLFTMNRDIDARTRYLLATINPDLFSLVPVDEINPVYAEMKDSFLCVDEEAEYMITRLLALGNTMITNSALRRGTYWHFLETYLHTTLYLPYMRAILSGVSRQLGMGEISVLFRAYGSQLAHSLALNGYDLTQLPSQLLGHPTIQQCLESSLDLFTPTNVLKNKTALLENTCRILGKSPDDVKEEYFGNIVGTQITTDLCEGKLELADKGAKRLSHNFPRISNFKGAFSEHTASIVVAILHTVGEQDFTDDGPIMKTLLQYNEEAARVFKSLVRYRDVTAFDFHTANYPSFDTQLVLESLQWALDYVPEMSAQSLSYHVLHMLMAEIHQTPLVNEQNRLLNAVCLWIACNSRHFEELSLLHTLAHNASLLLSQPDTARAAQSLLEWTFQRYISEKLPEPRIRSIITRCCAAAQHYTRHPTFSKLGSSIFDWVENQALRFLRHEGKTYKAVILDALSAWPRPLTEQLGQAYEGVKVQSVCAYLADTRVSSNKFHLSRRLKDFSASGLYSVDRFSESDFWRLKNSIPIDEEIQDDDIVAFATLLYLNRGQIKGLKLGEDPGNHPRHIHKHFVSLSKDKVDRVGDKRGSHDAIVSGLLAMLEDENPSRVFSAYRTLCLCLTVLNRNDFVTPKHYRSDLLHLINNRVRPLPRPTTRLAEHINSDSLQRSLNDFSSWICILATALTDDLAIGDIFYGQLHNIVASDALFSETILPILVHTLLEANAVNGQDSEHRRLLSDYFATVLKEPTAHPSCLQAIVDVVLHSRYFYPAKFHPLAHNNWLQLDFTLLAQAATRCGSYTTALLFLELDSEMKPKNQVSGKEKILYEIYGHIDEPDGFYGIKTDDLQSFLIKRFHHEEQWDKALRFHGAALEAGTPGRMGLIQSFHSFGFDHMALDTMRNADRHNTTSDESATRYRLGWRTETWDLPDPSSSETGAPLYLALRAVHRERDTHAIDKVVWSGMRSEVEHLRCLGSENVTEIRAASQDLMCLNQILQFRQDVGREYGNLGNKDASDFWKRLPDLHSGFGFVDLEALMTTRLSLLRSLRQNEEMSQIGNMATPTAKALMRVEKACLIQLSKAARASGKHQIALNSVLRAQRLDQEPSADVSEEFAHVLWEHKEEKTAVQFLQRLIRNYEESKEISASTKALWSAHLGSWTSEACLENPSQIWENYFGRAIELLHTLEAESNEIHKTRANVYRECAMFAERQYQAALKSPDGLRWKVYVERKRQEVAARNEQIARSFDQASKHALSRELERATKLLATDSELFKKHHSDRETFLQHAIDMHSRCLELSDEFDTDSVVRFSSLWFANFEDQTSLNWIMPALERISSRKFVFLAHQLTARMSDINNSSSPQPQKTLQRLVLRMCGEHPFHCLYQVYCLSDHSTGLPSSGRRQSGRSFSQVQSTQSDRTTAANNILDQLRGEGAVGQRVRDIERLCSACLQWAKYPIKNNKAFENSSVNHTIPTAVAIRSIENLKVPVSTARTPIDLTMEYNDCVWIARYDTSFRNAGGNSVPKIVTCLGSDGQKYKQLFKGEGSDDLRQDAVMEQVFDLVNSILRRDQETHRRSLQVRDYKVIPLDTQAGLLEFVGNTQQLGGILKRLHVKYNPKDKKPNEFLAEMKAIQKKSREIKLAKFVENRKQFKPAMRHYFTETQKVPLEWFRTRLAYTRSVATTSIVGHVLGLGDRHVSNILIDNVSGEVVHIDLGIAFEQGKLLPVPECVPFRMTADMVDGMGTSGTAGVFQRCAEETLRVLREESGVIMTVLEVFKHDPLHQWTVSEIKIHKAQDNATSIISPLAEATRFNFGIGIDMTSGSADEAADRALNSVARKLDKSLSVESTVNELIAEATDPMNLATIYSGWSPHL